MSTISGYKYQIALHYYNRPVEVEISVLSPGPITLKKRGETNIKVSLLLKFLILKPPI